MIPLIKKLQVPYLHKWSMLFSGQVPHTSNSSPSFWNLEDPCYLKYCFIRFFKHYWISFCINWFLCRMLGIICCISMWVNSCHHSKLMQQWVIVYQWQRCWAEQKIFIWQWSQQNIARFTKVKKEGREAWHTIFTTHIHEETVRRHRLAVNFAVD